LQVRPALHQRADAEINEVGRAGVFHEAKGEGGSHQDGGEADCGHCGMDEIARGNPHARRDADATPSNGGARQHKKHGGAGDKEEAENDRRVG
jgi:hypothetical protein